MCKFTTSDGFFLTPFHGSQMLIVIKNYPEIPGAQPSESDTQAVPRNLHLNIQLGVSNWYLLVDPGQVIFILINTVMSKTCKIAFTNIEDLLNIFC